MHRSGNRNYNRPGLLLKNMKAQNQTHHEVAVAASTMMRGRDSTAISVAANRMLACPGAAGFDTDTWTEKLIAHQLEKHVTCNNFTRYV